jgi:putative addiction module component (TIGR02574 family)
MSATITELTQQALGLSASERAELAHCLLISLEETAEQGVDQAWDEEIALRVERIKNSTAKGRPVEDVLADLRSRLE